MTKNRIRYWRDLRGLSRRELAEMVNTGESQIVKLERGERKLSEGWLRRLAPVLQCQIGDLLEGEDFPPHAGVSEEGSPFAPGPLPFVGLSVDRLTTVALNKAFDAAFQSGLRNEATLSAVIGAAITIVVLDLKTLPTSETLAGILLKGLAWAASEEQEGRIVSLHSAANFIRYAL